MKLSKHQHAHTHIEAPTSRRALSTIAPYGLLVLAPFLVWALIAACSSSDNGHCCSAKDPSVLPMPDKTDAGSVVTEDLQLNCESAACVSYQGSQPYCTQSCISDDSCPSGFTCAQVLHATPPPPIDGGPVDMKFCVKQGLTQCIK
jgi:hypothetical protein